jgi:hypothetical protein
MGISLTAVASCNGTTLSLASLSSAETGSNRNCTGVGCLFGPPLPIPNPISTPTSVCVVNSVSQDASGTMDCTTGVTPSLNLPLNSELFLAGDLFPNPPGIQVCPVCNHTCNAGSNMDGPCNTDADCPGAGAGSCAGGSVCHGGPNDGMACTPGASPINAGFPTSHDCPPDAMNDIGGLPIAFDLTTGMKTLTAVNNTDSGQNNVFCGYCRDINAAGTGCFEGDPGSSCPPSAAVKPCTSNADCDATFPDCEQRNPGAFGSAGGGAHTIKETGSPAGDLTDGVGHPATLVSIFCIQPTFNATVDAAGDLPGPGAVSLVGTAQLQ